MTSVTTKTEGLQPETEPAGYLFDNWFDPIESGIRERVREFISALIREELNETLARPRYGRWPKDAAGEGRELTIALKELAEVRDELARRDREATFAAAPSPSTMMH